MMKRVHCLIQKLRSGKRKLNLHCSAAMTAGKCHESDDECMSQPVTIDGKKYYLSSFGIKTLGFLNAPENQQNAYHIDGDEDDTATSGNEDKLMAMINSDPDTVVSFMQQLTTNYMMQLERR